ncbi:hypothetical protein C7957_1535 [Halanaerobium saccharolyticum]|jgi:hypothetical protein|uniref:Uncharacterized protein n=1 Tax=Halanaerobium saccharolyticum TaxID=43595 RepID=A0A4V3CV49_9FIRM|nr:hypothetical protein [Halanaerobium saccharolyticum]TDP81098.1 hypothetical protein C7957_1535 [Halanaerobium saccharolyticum]
MSLNYRVGNYYKAKNYLVSGFNFPEGKYKLKIIREGFPEDLVNDEDELIIAEEQWLEGLEGSDQYKTDLEGNWYYFEFPINDEGIEYMWVPESVVVEVFV